MAPYSAGEVAPAPPSAAGSFLDRSVIRLKRLPIRRTPSIRPPGRKITISMNRTAKRQVPAFADEGGADGHHQVTKAVRQEGEDLRQFGLVERGEDVLGIFDGAGADDRTKQRLPRRREWS